MLVSNTLVIGGSGFIGSHILAGLAAMAATPTDRMPEPPTLATQPVPGALPQRCPGRIWVATRDMRTARHLLTLPNVDLVEANVHDDTELDRLIGVLGPDGVVINLVGILHGKRGKPYGPGFAAAHVELPRRIVAACARHGVRRLLHMSALGAESAGPSMYLRSKGDGEAIVTNSALDWTVFRPSVVFGADDRFLNVFAGMQRIAPFVPLACAQAKFQPIAVEDVAQAFVHAFGSAETIHQCYDLGGPQVYTLAELVRFAGRASGHARPVIPLSPLLGRIQAAVLEYAPGGPLMSRDNLDSMQADSVLHSPVSPVLGIVPKHMETVMTDVLARRDRSARLDKWRMRND